MTKSNQILKTKEMIDNILNSIVDLMPNNKDMSEVRHHLKQASKCMDKISNSQKRKNNDKTQFESWWGNVMSGTAKMAQGNVSSQAIAKSLKNLQSMIDEESDKISSIETKVENSKFLTD